MKLLLLKLKNFKGIKEFEFKPEGQDASVYGDNAKGKTTLFDAYNWVLFGKDSLNRKDFPIKTLDENKQPIHGIEHEVEAIFEVGNKTLVLRKVFAEKWTKKRGSAQNEFTGHITQHYLNDVPVTQTEYDLKISEIAKEDIFKLLTNPLYFNTQLHWQERRKTLLEVCGDVSVADVIAANTKLKDLPSILGDHTTDEHKKVIADRRAKINKELETIPVRISEVQQSTPEAPSAAETELQAKVSHYQDLLRRKNQSLSEIENGGAISEKRLALERIESEIIRINNENQQAVNAKIQDIQQHLFNLKNEANEAKSALTIEQQRLAQKQANLSALESAVADLRARWVEINSETFSFEQDNTCPTCGQALPAEKLESARNKALADFNKRKAEKLEENVNVGKQTKEEIEQIKVSIDEIKASIATVESRLTRRQEEVSSVEAQIAKIKAEPMQLISNQTQIEKKQAIIAEIGQLQSSKAEAVISAKLEIDKINDCVVEAQSELSKFEQIKRSNDRINELKARERQLASEFEKLEHELYLIEEFTKAMVRYLESKINSKFRLVTFKLFETQINGGIQPCCETLYEGVPFSSGLNTGHRIIAGMDIIQTLLEHYDFSAPIFVDNAESVTKLPKVDAQVIRLIKPEINSEEDRIKYSKLNVVYAQQILKEAI